jgi:hypothetical protein
MDSRASSEAEAREPDSGLDVEHRASSEAEAREPDLGIDARERTLTGAFNIRVDFDFDFDFDFDCESFQWILNSNKLRM